MNFFKKIKDFLKDVFSPKTQIDLEIKIEESDVTTPVEPKVIDHRPFEMAPEEDEHVPSKVVKLSEIQKDESQNGVVTVKEIKSKSRTKKEKVVEEKPKSEKKSKKKN